MIYLHTGDPGERAFHAEVMTLQVENRALKEVLSNVKNKIEAKIAFCSTEAEGHINHEKCDKTILFLKNLLDDLKEV